MHTSNDRQAGNAWTNRFRSQTFETSLPNPFPEDDGDPKFVEGKTLSKKLQAIAIAFLGYHSVDDYLAAVRGKSPAPSLIGSMMEQDKYAALAISAGGVKTFADVLKGPAPRATAVRDAVEAQQIVNDSDAVDEALRARGVSQRDENTSPAETVPTAGTPVSPAGDENTFGTPPRSLRRMRTPGALSGNPMAPKKSSNGQGRPLFTPSTNTLR